MHVNRANKYFAFCPPKKAMRQKRNVSALQKKIVHDEDGGTQVEYNAVLQLASFAIVAHVVASIDRLGGNK